MFMLVLRVVAFALLVMPTVADACPSCKLVEDPIAQGFKWSILFLMAKPYIVDEPDWRWRIFVG